MTKPLKLEDPIVVTYPPDRRSVSPSKTPKLPKFRSPYLLTNLMAKEFSHNSEVEVHLVSDSTKDTLLPSISSSLQQADIQIPEVQLDFGKDVCPVCGFALDELENLEALSMGDVEIVDDIKFTIHCLKLLNVISSELCTPSRLMHFKLLQQLKFAIFPQETPGVFSAVPYYTIYEHIDKRKKAAEEELEQTKEKLAKLMKKDNTYNDIISDLRNQLETRDQLEAQLIEENKALKQAITDIQLDIQHLLTQKDDKLISIDNIQSSIDRLENQLHLKNLEMKVQREVFELKLEESKITREVMICTPKGLREKLRDTEEKLKKCSTDFEKQKRLHEIMINNFKKQVSEMRNCLEDKINKLEIELENEKFRDIKKESEWPIRKELENMIQISLESMSFDGLVRLSVVNIKACYDVIKQQAAKINQLQGVGSSLELSNLNIREQLEDLQHRVDMSLLYDVKLSTNFKKNSRYFVALGKGLEVPKFLRANGFVDFMDLSKKEVLDILNDMWKMKSKFPSRIKRPVSIQTYFYNFLRNKFSYMPKVVEYGYNLLDAAERYSDDPDCDIFLCILKEEMPEKAMSDITRMVKAFKKYLASYTDDGNLNKNEILDITHEFFCNKKSEEDMNILSSVLNQDIKTFKSSEKEISVNRLFEPISIMSTSRFIAAVKKQYLELLHKYYTSLTLFINQNAAPDCTISCTRIIEGLCIHDPKLDRTTAEKIVKYLFGQASIDINSTVNVKIVLKKLMMGYVKPKEMYVINPFNS
jgi:hypothetical protein